MNVSKEIADMYGRAENDFLRYYVQNRIAHSNKIPSDGKKIKFAPVKPLPKTNTGEVKKNIAEEINTMYESPIELTVSPLVTQMEEKQGQIILKACQDVGVNVKKFELMRALEYDRQQYDKGFEDGVKKFAKYLVDVSDAGFISVVDLVDYAAEMLGEGECEDAE